MNRRRIVVFLFLLFSITLGMLLTRIGQESFFIDEVVVARSCNQPTWHYVETIETSPPLYFFFIKKWSRVFGLTHPSLRAFSALCGAISVLLLYTVARELGLHAGWSLLSAILLALSPMAFWYGQQARHYALLCLFVTAWMLFFLRVRNRGSVGDLTALAVLLFAGFSTHYYFAFAVTGGLILAGANLLLAPRDKRLRNLCLIHGMACLSWLIYLPLLKKQLSLSHIEWNNRPKGSDFLDVYLDVFPGGPFNFVPLYLQISLATLFIFAAAALAFSLSPARSEIKPSTDHRLFNSLFLAASVIFPILLPILFSIFVKPIFNKDRYSIIALPAYFLLITYSFSLLRKPALRHAAFVLIVIMFLPSGLYYISHYWNRYQEFDWRGAIRIVESEWKAGDSMVFAPGWMKDTYADNNGKADSVIRTTQIAKLNHSKINRFWLFEWKGNLSPEDKEIVHSLRRSSKRDRVRVDFPHIRMVEIPLSPKQRK